MRKVSSTIDDKPAYLHAYRADYLSGFIKAKNPKVLDIGCWSGQFHEALKIKHQYYGVDIDEQVITYASRKHKKTKFKVGSASSIPYKKNFFDVVVFSEVIEHIPENTEVKALKEINKVMKKNAIIFLSTPLDTITSKLLDPAYWLINHRHYKTKELKKMLNKAGFELIDSREVGTAWHSVSHIIELMCKYTRFPLPKKLISFMQMRNLDSLKSDNKGYISAMILARKK